MEAEVTILVVSYNADFLKSLTHSAMEVDTDTDTKSLSAMFSFHDCHSLLALKISQLVLELPIQENNLGPKKYKSGFKKGFNFMFAKKIFII